VLHQLDVVEVAIVGQGDQRHCHLASCAAVIALADNRDLDHVQLMKHIKGPDFPTGGQLLNSKTELREIYKLGHGTIRVRGEYKRESGSAVAPTS